MSIVAVASMSLVALGPGVALAHTSPAIDWATYYGGPMNEEVRAIAATTGGGVLGAGKTGSSTGIVTPGAHQTVPGDVYVEDGFVARFDAAGQRVWGSYFGGGAVDGARAVAEDRGSGAVVLVGHTSSEDRIATPGAHQPALACEGIGTTCASDGFIAKFDGDGALLWATYFGGPGEDSVEAVAVDGGGELYVCGSTASASGIAVPGAHQPSPSGPQSAFLAKFDADGALSWATYYPGVDCKVALDAAGEAVYLAGWLSEPADVATPGAHQEEPGDDIDLFLARFSSDGERVWGTYYGGGDADYGTALAVDAEGSVYLAGEAHSYEGVATPGTHQQSHAGAGDLFVAKFDPAGARAWATYFGSDGYEFLPSLAVDAGGVYLAGVSTSKDLATPGAPEPNYVAEGDAVLAKFSGEGALRWATYHGGLGYEEIALVDVADGPVYLGGGTLSPDGMVTPGAFQPLLAGDYDAFLVQYSEKLGPDTLASP